MAHHENYGGPPSGATFAPAARSGRDSYHPHLMLELLIEQATHRGIAVRFVANLHPDHHPIAVFRRSNKAVFGRQV
jgi:hypothetical protein